MENATLVAILTGIAGIITAVGGILLAVRGMRTKERKAANSEIEELSELLNKERASRVRCEVDLHEANLLLVKNGIKHERN
jgi:hypothetical protein